MTRDDPKLVAKALIDREWNDSNTKSFTPDTSTGYIDTRSPLTDVELTISGDDESPLSPTGYTGIGKGGDPTSRRRGTVDVNVWANTNPDGLGFSPGKTNPAQLVSLMRDEVERIFDEFGSEIHAETFPNAPVTAEEYEYMSYLGSNSRPEEPEDANRPVKFRYLITLGYEYVKGN
jgi:hypothetical protein